MRDIKAVKESDVLVAETSEPSHGVGMEIMLAYTQGKEIICLFAMGAVISRIVRDVTEAFLIEYTPEKEVVEKLKKLL